MIVRGFFFAQCVAFFHGEGEGGSLGLVQARESARRGIFISFVRRTRKSTAKHHDGYFFTWQINRKALPLSFIRPSLLFHTFYLTTFVSLTPDICLDGSS